MNVLITGIACSGKTTVANELTLLGYDAINMDSIKGLCAWVDLSTGRPAPNLVRETAADWVDKFDWLWNGDKLIQLLSETDNTFYCGSSGNQAEFYHLFNKLFLLEMDEQLLRDRLANKTRGHDYGKRPGEIEAILSYKDDLQETAKSAGAIIIDARQSVKEIVETLLHQTLA